MENSNKLGTNFESESRSPLKEISVKNNKPAEVNENLNKTINIDMESSQIPAIVVRDTAGNSDNQENQEPVSFLSNFDPLKAETSDPNLSDSQYDDAVSVPETENIANITVDDSFVAAFANKLIVSPKLDESSKTQVSVSEKNLEEQNCNEQKEIVIDENSVLTDNQSDSQNNVTFCVVNTELPESQEQITTCDYNLNESIKPVVTEDSIENSNNTLNNNSQITEKNSEVLISDVEHIDPKTDVTDESYTELNNENSDINTTVVLVTNTVEEICQQEITNTFEVTPETIEVTKTPVSEKITNTTFEVTPDTIEVTKTPVSDKITNTTFEVTSETIAITKPPVSEEITNTTFGVTPKTIEVTKPTVSKEITNTTFEVTPKTIEVTKPPVSEKNTNTTFEVTPKTIEVTKLPVSEEITNTTLEVTPKTIEVTKPSVSEKISNTTFEVTPETIEVTKPSVSVEITNTSFEVTPETIEVTKPPVSKEITNTTFEVTPKTIEVTKPPASEEIKNISFEVTPKTIAVTKPPVSEEITNTTFEVTPKTIEVTKPSVSEEITNTSFEVTPKTIEVTKQPVSEEITNTTFKVTPKIIEVTTPPASEEITNTTFKVTPKTIEITKSPVSDEIIHPENIGAEINANIPTAKLIDISVYNINQSFEKNKTFNQDTEQKSINEQKSCLLESFNSTDNTNSKTLTDTIDSSDSLTCTNIVAEEVHMSSAEPNSDVKEISNRLSLENSATSTNDMGEIIECFEKQLDVSNGAVDNKESLEAKEQIYKEMTEKYATLEAESEKYKTQVCDLKKELKICRQKTVALEAEVADLKRRENELSILLEEKNKSPVETDSGTDQGEQVKRLQASEEALKNEVKELKGLVKQHENTLKDLQRKEVKLTDDLSCKTQSELQISRIMEEYEKSIAALISENEKMKKERDTAQMHLANIEMAFSDVHQKYERCKSIVQGYKDNEESFKQDIAMNRETIVIQEQKYETLKAHAMAQLEKSNQELAAIKKQHEGEMARLTAQLKRYEIKNMALTESLEQKAKECEQLAAICDEYIGSV